MAAPELRTLGRYNIERVLGKGAMGVVYEGLDPKLNRRVAIKTILKSHLDDTAARDYSARFVREAHAVARLNHPHIVQVYDFGEEGEVAYLVMEFIRGKELQGFFDAKERFELKEAVRIMGELCQALDFAHQAGIVHRDIKPANVMLDAQGNTKLTDFGVARVQDVTRSHATQGGTLVGTPAYMSPEQITGGSIDRRTDVFSAGIVLYQFLTGEMPFSGGGPWTIAKKIMQDQPALPSSLNTSVTPLFDAVVTKALAKNPDERYQSARELSIALKRALEGRPEQDEADRTVAGPLSAAAERSGALRAPASNDAEVEFWRTIKDSTDADDFDSYLQKFAGGIYADLARRKVARLRGDVDSPARREAQAQAKAAIEARAKQEADTRAREAEAQARARKEAEQKKLAEEKAKRDTEALQRRRQDEARKAPAALPAGGAPPAAPVRAIAVGVLIGLGLAVVAAGGVWFALKKEAPAPTAKSEPAAPQAQTGAAEQAAADKLAGERAAADKALAEAKAFAEKATAEKLAAQKTAAELMAAERAASDKVAAARLATERAAAERVAAEKATAELRAATERATAEKFAVEKASAERVAAERAAAGKAAAERAAAEKARPEPAKVASVARTPSTSRLPQEGDTWTYRLTQPDVRDAPQQQRYTVTVTSSSASLISDRYVLDSGQSGQVRHERGGYLVAAGPAVLSPYLAAFEDLAPGRLGRIAIRDQVCSQEYACSAEARVVGRETLKVAAGGFETIKVIVDHTWRAASAGSGHQAYIAQMNGGRTLTLWYAPAVKRIVKASSKLTVGDYPPLEANFDLELVSYQLN